MNCFSVRIVVCAGNPSRERAQSQSDAEIAAVKNHLYTISAICKLLEVDSPLFRTLCSIIMGHPSYTVESGSITFEGSDLLALSTDERARKGIFLSFQYPYEIPGVSLAQVTRAAMNAVASEKGAPLPSSKIFIGDLKSRLTGLGLSEDFLRRHAGFSGAILASVRIKSSGCHAARDAVF